MAQLGARLNGIQEVRGSTPLGSTKIRLNIKLLGTENSPTLSKEKKSDKGSDGALMLSAFA